MEHTEEELEKIRAKIEELARSRKQAQPDMNDADFVAGIMTVCAALGEEGIVLPSWVLKAGSGRPVFED